MLTAAPNRYSGGTMIQKGSFCVVSNVAKRICDDTKMKALICKHADPTVSIQQVLATLSLVVLRYWRPKNSETVVT